MYVQSLGPLYNNLIKPMLKLLAIKLRLQAQSTAVYHMTSRLQTYICMVYTVSFQTLHTKKIWENGPFYNHLIKPMLKLLAIKLRLCCLFVSRVRSQCKLYLQKSFISKTYFYDYVEVQGSALRSKLPYFSKNFQIISTIPIPIFPE